MSAKKSFKSANPAMQFISQSVVEPVAELPSSQEKLELKPSGTPAKVEQTHPMKLNPLYVETKSRRLNLLVQPSLHEKIKVLAKERGVSVNETIHQILQDYLDEQGKS